MTGDVTARILEASPAAMLVVDVAGVVIVANAAARALVGEAVVGASFAAVVTGVDLAVAGAHRGVVVGADVAVDVAVAALDEGRVVVTLAAAGAADELKALRTVANMVPALLAYWGHDLRPRYVNPRYAEYFNLTVHQMMRMTMPEVLGALYPLSLPRIEAVLRGEAQEFERRIPDPAGGPPCYSYAHYVPEVVDGRVLGYAVLITDVTERRRSEEESWARERDIAEARFRRVVEASPSAMVVIDARRTVVMVNRQAEELTGHSREFLIGRAIDVIIPQRNRAEAEAFVPPTAPRWSADGRFVLRADEREVPVEIGVNPIETPEGILTLVSFVDVTERRHNEAALRRFAAIVESSDDAIVSKSITGIVTSWNRGAAQLYGFSAAEAVGKSIELVVPERLFDEETQLMARIAEGEHITHYDTVRRRKDGSELDVSVTLSPIRDSQGVVVGASSIARDITATKARDAELQRSNAELEQFAYVASHDLQEPLRMVANYTELLAQRYRGKLDEKADKYIHYASDGARRMQRLVADLLAYSRVGSQGAPTDAVDLNVVVNRVCAALRGAIGDNDALIERGQLPGVAGDAGQLELLFQNLIGNAIKFRSAARPHIRIEGAVVGDRVRVTVADNGIGFEMEFADRIFQMFQRLHEVGKYDGSGIGLAIAKRIVQRHGGNIFVTSEPGVGTTFTFTLPKTTTSSLPAPVGGR